MMGFHKYSHCFTRVQLELIIDDYLGLAPYYKILHKQMKEYIRRIEHQQENVHNCEKVHPIRIYTKDYLSKNFQDGDTTELHIAFQSPKCDIRTTYSSVVAKYYYIYPLEVIVEILQSENYYKELPKNIIINHLLTTENLQIIIETLTIISEEMSKKIKTTLSSKEVKKVQVLCKENFENKREEDYFFQVQLPVIQEEMEFTLPQSKIDIPQQNLFDEEEETQRTRKMEKKRTYNPLIRTQGMNYPLEQRCTEGQKGCSFCQNYLIYLSETNGEGFGDDCLNKLSKESIKYLKVIAQTVTHFTLYLMENNLTQIPNNIHVLNRVLNNTGIVITEDIFNSELNPKNKKITQISYSKPRNLIEHLAPYFNSMQVKQKQRSKDVYAIDELFRMVIYCPTVEEVTLQLQNYQVEQFERSASILKCVENEEKVKSLLKKEFNYIKQYENERLEISKNTINTKPIYKQLQFEEQQLPAQNTQPQNYNVNSSLPTSRVKTSNTSKYPFLQKNQTCSPIQNPPSKKQKQNKSLLIELTNSISHNYKTEHSQQEMDLKKSKSDKNKFKKIPKQKKQSDNSDRISNNLKKNVIKNQCYGQNKSNQQLQQISSALLKPPSLDKQIEKQLSESDFRKLLYSSYAKNQGFIKPEPSVVIPSANYTAPNLNNYLNSSAMRSTIKKNNGYSSSLTQFIGRKQEEEHIECMEKLEKETYNRQLLNGEFVRNEIYEEINLGAVKVYENYANACGLVDSLRLEQLTEDQIYRHLTSDSTSSRHKLLRSCSKNKNSNVIVENSTKYNQSGIIRNEKYNKSIKSELINHRQSYLRNIENQNLSKIHLAQTSKLKKGGSKNEADRTIKDLYNEQLRKHLENQQKVQQHHSNFNQFHEI